MKLPQLRLVVTDACDSKCVYCRPMGEGLDLKMNKNQLALEDAIRVTDEYVKAGGQEVKITGGDPVFWKHLARYVDLAKNTIGLPKLELITRSKNIVNQIDGLISLGLDTLNFSLDTLNSETYSKVTGKDDFHDYIKAIQFCSPKIKTKINTVVMKGINQNEISNIIDFCDETDIKELKLLDIITDLHDVHKTNNDRLQEQYSSSLRDLFLPLSEIEPICRENSVSMPIEFQGGLGHPLKVFIGKKKLKTILKDSDGGAWYHELCKDCERSPCHDALMAVRMLPSNHIQLCMLNEDKCIDMRGLSDEEYSRKFSSIMRFYDEAQFYKECVNEQEKNSLGLSQDRI